MIRFFIKGESTHEKINTNLFRCSGRTFADVRSFMLRQYRFKGSIKGNDRRSDSGETTPETEEETKKYLDDIPDNVKFDGDTVSFLASFTSSSIALLDNDDATEVVQRRGI